MERLIEETMLFRYSCKDMGLICPFIAKSEALEEVTKTALEHVLAEHREKFNNLQPPRKIERMRLALERSTRVEVVE